MKRLQILIDEELDVALERQAQEEGVSKASLIRRFVRDNVAKGQRASDDSLWDMVAADDFAPGDIDDVVYR